MGILDQIHPMRLAPNPFGTAWALVIQVALDPDVTIPSQIRVEHGDELLDCNPIPVASVKKFHLEPSEEALAPRVVGAAALPRHRSDQAVLFAYLYPAWPAIMTASIRMHGRVVALVEPLTRSEQRGVCHLGIWRSGNCPAHNRAVEAVEDGAEIQLASRD